MFCVLFRLKTSLLHLKRVFCSLRTLVLGPVFSRVQPKQGFLSLQSRASSLKALVISPQTLFFGPGWWVLPHLFRCQATSRVEPPDHHHYSWNHDIWRDMYALCHMLPAISSTITAPAAAPTPAFTRAYLKNMAFSLKALVFVHLKRWFLDLAVGFFHIFSGSSQ